MLEFQTPMPKKRQTIPVAETVPWSDDITAYDEAHLTLYLRLLDAKCDGAKTNELLKLLKDYGTTHAKEVAQKALQSHLDRAQWMTHTGFRLLLKKTKADPQRKSRK